MMMALLIPMELLPVMEKMPLPQLQTVNLSYVLCLSVSLSLSLSLRVCPFPFLQTLNPNSGHFLDTKSAAFNWRLVSDFQSPHVFLEIAEEEEEEKLWMLMQNSSLPMPPL
jgi:hypothetical protein